MVTAGSKLATLVLLFTPTLCLAWGADGHCIVGDIASHYLTLEAEADVRLLNSRLMER